MIFEHSCKSRLDGSEMYLSKLPKLQSDMSQIDFIDKIKNLNTNFPDNFYKYDYPHPWYVENLTIKGFGDYTVLSDVYFFYLSGGIFDNSKILYFAEKELFKDMVDLDFQLIDFGEYFAVPEHVCGKNAFYNNKGLNMISYSEFLWNKISKLPSVTDFSEYATICEALHSKDRSNKEFGLKMLAHLNWLEYPHLNKILATKSITYYPGNDEVGLMMGYLSGGRISTEHLYPSELQILTKLSEYYPDLEDLINF